MPEINLSSEYSEPKRPKGGEGHGPVADNKGGVPSVTEVFSGPPSTPASPKGGGVLEFVMGANPSGSPTKDFGINVGDSASSGDGPGLVFDANGSPAEDPVVLEVGQDGEAGASLGGPPGPDDIVLDFGGSPAPSDGPGFQIMDESESSSIELVASDDEGEGDGDLHMEIS